MQEEEQHDTDSMDGELHASKRQKTAERELDAASSDVRVTDVQETQIDTMHLSALSRGIAAQLGDRVNIYPVKVSKSPHLLLLTSYWTTE